MIPKDSCILIVSFESGAPESSHTLALKRAGLPAGPDRRLRWHGATLMTARLKSMPEESTLSELSALPGVIRARALPPGGRLVSASEGAVPGVDLGGVRAGGRSIPVIAGPCSVESESQIREIAAFVKSAGAVALRGGAFKPRTSPYSWGGLHAEGLRALALAREDTGLPIVTELLGSAEALDVAAVADVLQIGTRNMHGFPLLFEAGKLGKPVLLKRAFAATIEETIEAAEYVALGQFAAGLQRPQILLCERGIRTFERSTRFTLDVGAVPVLQEHTCLPVIVDPSHPAGLDRYVAPLACAAVAAGADGLLVEVHCDPSGAWCDGAESLSFAQFEELMRQVRFLEQLRPALTRRRLG